MPLWESLSKLLVFDERDDHPLKQYMQIEVAIFYLLFLKQLRKAFLYVIGVGVALVVLCIGLSYLIISLASSAERYFPPSLGVGIVLIIIPILVVGVLLLESTWIRAFGAENLLKKIEENQKKHRNG